MGGFLVSHQHFSWESIQLVRNTSVNLVLKELSHSESFRITCFGLPGGPVFHFTGLCKKPGFQVASTHQRELSQTGVISHWVKYCKGFSLCIQKADRRFQTTCVSISPCHLHRKLRADFNHVVILVYLEHRLTLLRKQLARSSGFSVHFSNSFRKVLWREKDKDALIFTLIGLYVFLK